MIRVVIDTYVVISAMLSPIGYPSAVLHTIITNENFGWFVTDTILREYETVIWRPRFGLPASEKKDLLKLIHENVTTVNPEERVTILKDEADNRFLECAHASAAHFLITGDRRHFGLLYFRKSRIITPREFIEIILGV